MNRHEIEKSLTNHANGALVTITDIAVWSGRSKEYLKANILNELKHIGTGTSKFYFVGDVARAIAEKSIS